MISAKSAASTKGQSHEKSHQHRCSPRPRIPCHRLRRVVSHVGARCRLGGASSARRLRAPASTGSRDRAPPPRAGGPPPPPVVVAPPPVVLPPPAINIEVTEVFTVMVDDFDTVWNWTLRTFVHVKIGSHPERRSRRHTVPANWDAGRGCYT